MTNIQTEGRLRNTLNTNTCQQNKKSPLQSSHLSILSVKRATKLVCPEVGFFFRNLHPAKRAWSPGEVPGGRGHAEAPTPHRYEELQGNGWWHSALPSSLLPHSKRGAQATGALSLGTARSAGLGRQRGATEGGGGGERSSDPTWSRSRVSSQLVKVVRRLSLLPKT